MATSVYFNGAATSEQNLYEDLVVESLKMFGQDVVYIPRTMISHDDILNEEYAKFDSAFEIEMWIQNVEGYEGDGNLLGKFGLEIRDQATFVVAKRRWEASVGTHLAITAPAEGDLIYLTMADTLFEIRYVEPKAPFYQLQKLPVYEMQCELFEYGNEEFDTNIVAIDQIESFNATQYWYELDNGNGTNFEMSETVRQWTGVNDGDGNPINIEGEISSWVSSGADSGQVSIVSHVTTDGKFSQFYVSTEATKAIIGTESGANYQCVSISVAGKSNFNNEDNDIFETIGDSIIDFTESNPFGDP
jgi:hypothetical protein